MLFTVDQAEVNNRANILLGAQHGQAAAVGRALRGDLHELAVPEHTANKHNTVVDVRHAGRQGNFAKRLESQSGYSAGLADVDLKTLELSLAPLPPPLPPEDT